MLITVFIFIFVSNDTFLFGSNSISLMVELPRILMGVYVLYELIRWINNGGRINKIIILGLTLVGLMVCISLYHGDPVKLIIIKCLCILSSMFLTLRYDFSEYAEAFSRIIVFLAMMALVLEVIAYVIPSIAYALPRVVNTANTEITTIGLAGFATNYLSTNIIRAFGIFWEPGVFHIYLNIALVFELFQNKVINWRNVVIMLLAVFVTFSTTGYIVSAWILVAYFCLERKKVLSSKNLIITCMIFVCMLAVFFMYDFTFINDLVFSKLGNAEDGNWIARSASVFVNLDIFFDNPILGIGMNQINDEFVRRSAEMFVRSSKHNTNTLLYQFAAHGGIYGGIFTVGTLLFPKCLTNKRTVKIALAIAIVLMYVGENLRYSMFPFILIFYGFTKKNYIENRCYRSSL